MTRQEFWNLIAETRRDDPYEHGEALTRRLTAMPEKEILSFGRHFEELVGAAYSWKLWGAAHLINGGCSDDGFEYFRHWLLLQGQTVYEAALRDPDGLAALEVEEDTAEADINPAAAHEAKTGRDDYYELLQQQADGRELPDLGDGWDFEDDAEMRKRYPRLFAMYFDVAGGEDGNDD